MPDGTITAPSREQPARRREEAGRARNALQPAPRRPVELPNRIVSTAHQTTLVHEHLPTEDFVAYHEARARRHRADRPRGDGRASVRPADAAHARRVPRRSCRRWPASQRCTRTGHGSSCSSSTAGGSRSRAPSRARARSVGDPEPPLPRRARSRRGRSTPSSRGSQGRRRWREGRPRRDRDLGRARVPRRAVLHARAEPARRRVGRAVSLPARRARRRARGGARRRGRRPPLCGLGGRGGGRRVAPWTT